MRLSGLLLIGCLLSSIGCDAISRTEFVIYPSSENEHSELGDVMRHLRDVSEEYGLKEIKDLNSTICLSDKTPGENPSLWLTTSDREWPISIEIAEMYIARRTVKHKQLVESLVERLEQYQYRIENLTSSDSSRVWLWTFVVLGALSLVAIVYRRTTRRGCAA
jgi:hypothetical protein